MFDHMLLLGEGQPKQPAVTIIVGTRQFAKDLLREAGRQGKLNRGKFDWFYPGKGFIMA